MSKEYIYCLKEPGLPTIWYVGRTNNLEARLYQHIRDAVKGGNTLRDEWVRSLLLVGKSPIIEMLEECDSDTVKQRERYWIGRMIYLNPSLKNTNSIKPHWRLLRPDIRIEP